MSKINNLAIYYHSIFGVSVICEPISGIRLKNDSYKKAKMNIDVKSFHLRRPVIIRK